MRRVLLCPVGTRGDLDPMLALAKGLHDAGVEVVLCASRTFAGEIHRHPVAFTPIAQDEQAFNRMRSETLEALPWRPRVALDALRACFAEAVDTQFEALLDAVEGCDLLIGGSGLHFAGPSVAEARGLPYRLAALSPPVVRSKTIGPAVLDWPLGIPTALLGAAWSAYSEAFGVLLRGPINRWRKRLGLAPFLGDMHEHLHGNSVLLAVDPELCPTPPGYPADTIHTHAWRIPWAGGGLSEEVRRFLDAGSAPVFVGFGSDTYSQTDPARVASIVLRAVRRARRRLLFARPPWHEVRDLRDDVLVVSSVNHMALFPRCAMVVHHAGAGVTQSAARCGRVQLGLPHMTDLFDWGRRIGQLGLGPAPLRLQRLEEEALYQRLRLGLATPSMQARATEMAARIGDVNGVDEAVRALLQRYPLDRA